MRADSLRDEDAAVQYRHFDISRLCDYYRGRDALSKALAALDPETCTVCHTIVSVGIGMVVAKKRDLPGLERLAGGCGVPQLVARLGAFNGRECPDRRP
jgi:hypothetical protein